MSSAISFSAKGLLKIPKWGNAQNNGLSGRDDKEAEGEGDEALLYFSKNLPKMINDPSDYCNSKQPTSFRPLDDSWTRRRVGLQVDRVLEDPSHSHPHAIVST
jgi:hypothetical protein